LASAAPLREMTADDWHAVAYAQYRAGNLAESHAAVNQALRLEPRHLAAQELSAVIWQTESQRLGAQDVLLPAGFERTQDSTVLSRP
jgi:Tfp pilus assembly protein PilF